MDTVNLAKEDFASIFYEVINAKAASTENKYNAKHYFSPNTWII